MRVSEANQRALTQARLKEVLRYEPATGFFYWRVTTGPRRAGDLAGHPRDGYIFIKVDSILYCAGRLAWLYVYGRWPNAEIDHINIIKSDNRIANLREASRSENTRNTPKRRDYDRQITSDLKGVHRANGRWRARITAQGHSTHLGYFDTPAAAHLAYCEAASKLHGDFARTA